MTLSDLLNLSGLRSSHWGNLKGILSFLPLWEFQGWTAELGCRICCPQAEGNLQAAIFFLCLTYFLR